LARVKKPHLDGEESLASEADDAVDPPAKQENGFGTSPKQKENGQASLAEAKAAVASSDGGVVNLDEDSDEDMDDLTDHKEAAKPTEKAAKRRTRTHTSKH